MDGVVAVKPLGRQALDRMPHRGRVVCGDLVLDRGVQNGMSGSSPARQTDPRSAMIILYEMEAFLLIEPKPLFGVGLDKRIVLLH